MFRLATRLPERGRDDHGPSGHSQQSEIVVVRGYSKCLVGSRVSAG
jgi:hypothetical protein